MEDDIKRRKRRSLFLFDPISTIKTPVEYDTVVNLVEISSKQLAVYICRKAPIYKLGAFLCAEEKTTKKDLREMMAKWKSDEVKREIWKYTDETKKHQVSNLGRVRSVLTNGYRFLFATESTREPGLQTVKVNYKGKYKRVPLKRLVAETFLFNDDPANKVAIVHNNGLQGDCRADNLRYVTMYEARSLAGKSAKANRKGVIRREIGTGKFMGYYPSLSDAERKTGVKRQNITKCIKGLRPSAGSSTWEYVDDDFDEEEFYDQLEDCC